jgi:hypothetical protein
MMKNPVPGRGLVRVFSLAAAAMLMLSTMPDERAEALSLINPAMAPAAKHVSDGLTTEVRGGHGGGGHGGGGHGGGGFRGGGGAAFHSSGIRSGGAVFRGGGFRAVHVFRGGYRHGGYRFAHRHHFRPRYYGYAPSYYYYPHRYCRIVWTYYGPRRICHHRPWYHHHRRHHWRVYW